LARQPQNAWTPKPGRWCRPRGRQPTTLSEVEESISSFTNHSIEHFVRARAEVRQVVTPAVRLLAGVAVKRSDLDYSLQDGAYRNEWGILVPAVRSTWADAWTDTAAYAEAVLQIGQVRCGRLTDHATRRQVCASRVRGRPPPGSAGG
jgi:hypothetical protein